MFKKKERARYNMRSDIVKLCYAFAWILVFASMAFAEPSGPPGGDNNNGTNGHDGNDKNGTAPPPYANVTVTLVADYDAHRCALDVNYSSSQLDINKRINITGAMPNASISEDAKQFLLALNRSLAESGGSFMCQLFTNGSGSGSQGSGQQEHPPIDPNGTAKCSGAGQEAKPAPTQLISGIAHLLEQNLPGSEPDPNISSMLSPLCPFGLPYANVSVILIIDNGTRSCFLGINYSSRAERFEKLLNITGAMPNASISAGRYQAILVLNSSLAAAGGAFKCVLFSNGSAECFGKNHAGNPVPVPFPALALRDAGIGKGLDNPSLPGPNDTNGLGLLCPYGAGSNATDGDKHHGGNETNNSAENPINLGNIENGTGNSSGQQGTGETAIGENTTHRNITGQGGAQINNSNGTAGLANTNVSNASSAGTAATESGFWAGLMLFIASHAVAAIIFISVIAVLAYAVLKRSRSNSQ
jgi:hypothetical protein